MDRITVANSLVVLAESLVGEEEEKEAKMIFNKGASERDITEAQMIVIAALNEGQDRTVTAGVATLDRLPGLSPMQLKQQIDLIVDVRQQATILRHQYESVLSEIERLEGIEKEGIAKLQDAARHVKEKEKYLIESEKGLLTFTAFMAPKVPGVEQMLKNPEEAKPGEKAGDFFGRIGAKLGAQVLEAVSLIYNQTKDDLTHMADGVRTLKVVSKTAGVTASTVKKAGLVDILISIKEWISGDRPDSLAAKLLNFTGDLSRWVRGFVERTGLVKSATKKLTDALEDAQREISEYLAV